MMPYPLPQFAEPEPYGFIYLGFQAEPAQRLPVYTRTPHPHRARRPTGNRAHLRRGLGPRR
jgi:hypothetical protein